MRRLIVKVLPPSLINLLKRLRDGEKSAGRIESEIGDFVLSELRAFSLENGGDDSAIEAEPFRHLINNRPALKIASEAHQYLQTAVMKNYESQLYEYYREQQYFIFMAFLSYPFRGVGGLRSFLDPLEFAASKFTDIHLLDYGAGIPFGLINILRQRSTSVKSITLVDYNLLHAHFVKFLLERLAPEVELRCLWLTDSESLPNLGGSSFNVLFAKDIFEHVHKPELLASTLLEHAAPSALCLFDINDHGERHLQHVQPNLDSLSELVEQSGFSFLKKIGRISAFEREAI